MSYLIGVNPRAGLRGDLHGAGLGYVGDLGAADNASKDALSIAKATQQSAAAGQLRAAQIAYDAKADALRNQLRTANAISMTSGGKALTSAQIEAEVVRRLGRRPITLLNATGTVVAKPQPGDPVFTGQGADIASSAGPPVALIAGGIAAVGLLVMLSRRGG